MKGVLSLQAKLLWAIIPCSIGALMLVAMLGYWQLRSFAVAALEKNVANLAAQSVKEIEAAISQCWNDLSTLAQNPLFADYHSNVEYRLQEEAAVYRSAITVFLAGFARRAKVYPDIRYLDIQTGEVCRIVQERPIAASGRPALREPAAQRSFNGGNENDFPDLRPGPDGQSLFYFARPVRDHVSSVIGVIVVGYSLAALESRLASAMTWAHGEVSLEDEGGKVIAGRHSVYQHPIERMIALPGRPWTVRAALEGEFYLAPIRRARNWALVIGSILCAIIAFLVFGAVRSIAGPIRDLAQGTRELSKGNLDYRVRVQKPLELRILSSAFNEMASRIKAREEEQKRLQDYLIRSEKLSVVGKLIASIAHELNNPLSGVTGYAELMLDMDCSEALKGDLKQIQAHALRCRRIIDNLLLFVRQGPHEKKQVDVNRVIRSVLALLEYRLTKVENIQVVFSAGKIPPVEGNFGQLEQIVINLIQNACDAVRGFGSPKGRRIVIRTEPDGDHLQIAVNDNGVGIAPEHQGRIFEPFFTTKAVGEGTGLGLAIVSQIIKDHGGDIECRSQLGEGTSFVIRLPVLLAPESVRPETETPAPRRGNARTVLVVDDERDVARMIVRLVGKAGHRGEAAYSAGQAISKITRKDYDLILLDLEMPHQDGQDLYRYFLESRPAVISKLIFMTGNVLSSDALDFLARHHRAYLKKPFDGNELAKILSSAGVDA